MSRIRFTSITSVGLLIAAAFLAVGSAAADTTTVTASGFTFSPAHITIQLGDTVHWDQVTGSHTVTSGTGAADPNAGALFNETLSVVFSNVYVTFGAAPGTDTAGVYPYHCTPHEFLGMKGTVTVEGVQVGIAEPPYVDASWGELKSLFAE